MAIEQMEGVCECGASNFMFDKWISMAERLNGETCMFHANGRCWRCGMVLTADGRAVYPTTLPADATGAAVTSEATADLIKRVEWYFAGDDEAFGAEIVAALQQAADPEAMVPRAALEWLARRLTPTANPHPCPHSCGDDCPPGHDDACHFTRHSPECWVLAALARAIIAEQEAPCESQPPS